MAKAYQHYEDTYYMPDSSSASCMQFLVVLDHDDWECVPTKCMSPLALKLAGVPISGCVVKQVGPAMGLIAGAGLHCVHDLPEASIAKLALLVGCDLSGCVDLFDKLKALLTKVLPEYRENDILPLLEKRLSKVALETCSIISDDISECFGNYEAGVQKFLQAQRGEAAAHQPYRKTFALRSRLLPPAKHDAAAVMAPRPQKRARLKKPCNDYVNQLFDEKSARSFMPSTGTLYKDQYNRRWLAFSNGCSRSRSWTMAGDFHAMLAVLAWAWQQHQEIGGEACPHAWIAKAMAKD